MKTKFIKVRKCLKCGDVKHQKVMECCPLCGADFMKSEVKEVVVKFNYIEREFKWYNPITWVGYWEVAK